MRKIILQILVALFLAVSVSTQENQPRLLGEFGEMPIGAMKAYVDGVAYELNELPNHKVLVRIYGGRKYSFASAYVRGSQIKSFWANFVKRPAEKLLIQFCNINEEPIRTEFFAIRENDKVESCDENLIVPKKTVLFYTAYFDTTYFEVPEITFDPIEKYYPAVEGSSGEYSEFAQNILKSFLKNSPGNKIYIIAYLNANFESVENGEFVTKKVPTLDRKSYANKMFRAARKELIKNGFLPSQIVTINGGYINGNGRRLEFWFVPKGGEIPKPKPDYIPKKIKK